LRLRQIVILAQYARMKLEGIRVVPLDTFPTQAPSKPADKL